MSTLFLVGCHSEDVSKTSKYDYEDLKTRFQRIVEIEDLSKLFQRLYHDRIQTLPNRWNYETGVSLVIIGNDKEGEIRQLVSLRDRFTPTFNIRFIHLNDELTNWNRIIDSIIVEQKLCKLRVRRMNHWMHHHHHESDVPGEHKSDENSCQFNLYSMLNHLTNAHRANEENIGHEIPKMICNIDFEEILSEYDNEVESLPQGFKDAEYYLNLFNNWNFSALNLTTRQLIIGGYHLLTKLARDAKVHIATNELLLLLFTLESSYHQINRFHNFKHAIDVMQATWNLCQILLPHDPELTLLICLAAIGHDIGHPGTNNGLFWKESDLSRLFHGTSILENFHFQMFHEIVRTIWPSVLELPTNNTIIEESGKEHDLTKDECMIQKAILATDMSFHGDYVKLLGKVLKNPQYKLNQVEIISFIIKAADISNVTRPLNVSAKWAYLITLEFKDCAQLQEYNKMEDGQQPLPHLIQCEQPFTPEELEKLEELNNHEDDDMSFEIELNDNIVQEPFQLNTLLKEYPMIPKGQLFFMDTFAYDFFNKLSLLFPDLKFLIDNIESNKKYWLEQA